MLSTTRAGAIRVAANGHHPTVANWVTRNRSKVISYYPLDDAVAGGTMRDATGAINGTYGSVVSATTINNIAAANFSSITSGAQVSSIADNAAFDSMTGVFLVATFSTLANANVMLQRRSPSDVTADRFQFFTNPAGNQLAFTNFGTPSTALASGLVTSTTYTFGVGFHSGLLALYVNGALVDANATGNPFPAASTNKIDVGCGTVYGAGQQTDGAMCEVVFLSQAPPTVFAQLHSAWSEQKR